MPLIQCKCNFIARKDDLLQKEEEEIRLMPCNGCPSATLASQPHHVNHLYKELGTKIPVENCKISMF